MLIVSICGISMRSTQMIRTLLIRLGGSQAEAEISMAQALI
jgi:hypothetical protein